jgi:ribonucleoside-triphosphate reductase
LSNNKTFPTDYEEFIYKSRYARWDDSLGRREDWPETVNRYVNYLFDHVQKKHGYVLDSNDQVAIENAILNFEVMPSMRALMSAGPALERDNTAGYNCSYLPVDAPESFDEAMYILMCGTGVGFSVEKKYVKKLPAIPALLVRQWTNIYEVENRNIILVQDSKEGWAHAYRELITYLYDGVIPSWDTALVRPAGARLKTFGGRASGPKPLEELFQFTVDTFAAAAGRKLTSLEAHDLMCKIGEVVVVGGVRRSAMISLSDLDDQKMAKAKSGDWWNYNGQRSLANNSVAYEEKPNASTFLGEWTSLIDSNSGERGIFNRQASQLKAGQNGRRIASFDFGTNPCSEIILRPYQFCNLTEVVVRSNDTAESLRRKVRVATLLGTLQATLTDFPYLRDIWKKNTEEERLLGVSLTGIMDNVLTASLQVGDVLKELRNEAVKINAEYAAAIGIPASTAITCVKPSGTVSQLVDSASGIHDRHSPYYIRTVRADNKDPLTSFLKDSGIPWEADVTKPDTTTVFSFPQQAPYGAIVRDSRTAIQQLELWLVYQRNWCEHKPSITVNVKPEEWVEVGAWVYEHFDEVSGVSFLPYDGGSYRQAPYQAIDKKTYMAAKKEMPPKLDWSILTLYEKEDNTTGSQTLACVGAACEIVDLSSN